MLQLMASPRPGKLNFMKIPHKKTLLTNTDIMMTTWHDSSTDNPENPDDDGEDHHNADVERFRKVVLDISEPECHTGDEDYKEDDVEE